jgi:hypothetical protein
MGLKERYLRRPAWLRRSLAEGARYPWLVAVKDLTGLAA